MVNTPIQKQDELVPIDMDKNYTDPVVKRGTALKLGQRQKSGFRKAMSCIVKVLFWGCLSNTSSRSKMISTKKRIAEYSSNNKPTAKHHNRPEILNVVRWDSMQINNWSNWSQHMQRSISKPEGSHEMLVNFNMYVDEPVKVLRSGSEWANSVRNTFYFSNARIQGPDEQSEDWSKAPNFGDYQDIEVLEAGKYWEQKEILVFINPKNESHSDMQVILPSGKEENEDMTFLETDTLVNVAPSRMSTRMDLKAISGENWSERLDMLLMQAYKQFPDNWAKISKVLGQKKNAEQCRDRHRILSALRIEGHFTMEEDRTLKSAFDKYGKQWALIARKCFKGRTAKQIKDRYYNSIGKQSSKLHVCEIKEQQTWKPENTEGLISPPKVDRNHVMIKISSFANMKSPAHMQKQGTVVEHWSDEESDSDDGNTLGGNQLNKNYLKESISVSGFKK